jgi:bifunctional ADP-heptose synthase (sugar kinase/adenylyltransferase)
VDLPETGVVTNSVLGAIRALAEARSELPIIADSRRGLRGYPPVIFKMNASELLTLMAAKHSLSIEDIGAAATQLARQNGRIVFVSMAERGLLGATPDGVLRHVPALPVRGEIDVVGAGDAVSANLASALAAGASVSDALELANVAASVVIHKLGTTGTATVKELGSLICS